MSEVTVRYSVPEAFAELAANVDFRERLVARAAAIRAAGADPDESTVAVIARLHRTEWLLRVALDVPALRERARHDYEEDARDPEPEPWSPRSAYFDDEYNREGDPHLNGAFG